MTRLLALHDVNAAYGSSRVLFGVSLEVAQGECVCLMGRNGVGKTTTLRSIMGLTPPTSGRVVIDGSLGTTDYEFAAAGYPHNHADFNGLVDLDPNTATHAVRTFDCVADDDTLGRLILTFDLQSDGAIQVKTTIRCYDSNKADTDDYDEGSLDPFMLPKGGHSHWSIYVDGDNYAEAYFHVSNVTDPS